jgi:DNA polymerase III epsilon subunit family exonuclease
MPAQNDIVNIGRYNDISAMKQMSEWLRRQTFVAFDTETTGMWAPVHRLVEIGGVKFSPERDDTETFSELINPQRPIPADVIPVHGITDSMVAHAATAGDVLSRFESFCGDAIMIAHNAAFDLSFVVSELERFTIALWAHPVIDTVDLSRKAFPGMASYSLLSLGKALDLCESQSHRALSDAELVRRLFLKALPTIGDVDSLETLRSRIDVMSAEEFRPTTVALAPHHRLLAEAVKSGGRIEIRYARPDAAATVRIIRPK